MILGNGMSRVKHYERAVRAGYEPRASTVQVITLIAPRTAAGCIKYYLLEHGWTCGTCGDRVLMSKFKQHVKRIH